MKNLFPKNKKALQIGKARKAVFNMNNLIKEASLMNREEGTVFADMVDKILLAIEKIAELNDAPEVAKVVEEIRNSGNSK